MMTDGEKGVLLHSGGDAADFPDHPPISDCQPQHLYRDPLMFDPEVGRYTLALKYICHLDNFYMKYCKRVLI